MADYSIQQVTVQQQKPYPKSTWVQSVVNVTFTVGPDSPDFVEVDYDSGQGQTYYGTYPVTAQSGQNPPPIPITLYSGSYYNICVYPQLKDENGHPSTVIDGDSYRNFGACAGLEVMPLPPAGNGSPDYPVPENVQATPYPATLQKNNHITVTWSSPRHKYDAYQIIWKSSHFAYYGQTDLLPCCSWDLSPTEPGRFYSFKVEGGDSKWWGLTYDWSQWSQEVTTIAVQNLTGLRAFLAASGYDPTTYPVRANVLKSGGSVRKFMKLA